MMDWLTQHKNEVEFRLQLYRRSTSIQGGVFMINVLGVAWNSYELMAGHNISSFGLGAFLSNLLWTAGFFAMNYGEWRDAKEQQKRLKEWEKDEEYKQAVQMHHEFKKKYEEALNVMNKHLEEVNACAT